jgi:hypothetical protein
MKVALTTLLAKDEALQRIGSLLDYENVEHKTEGHTIVSTHIPYPILNFDKRLYSRRNWVGVNPFLAFDDIRVSVTEGDEGSLVEVDLGLTRFIVHLSFVVVLAGAIAFFLPHLLFSVGCFAVIVGVFVAIFFGKKSLVEGEMKKAVDIEGPRR